MHELCDRSWIKHFNEKCLSAVKEYSACVCRLQDGLIKEQEKSRDLATRCKTLQQEVSRLEQQLRMQNKQTGSNTISSSSGEAESDYNKSSSATEAATEMQLRKERQRLLKQQPERHQQQECSTPFSREASPALLNNAMHSEQLQMDTSGLLSPGQRPRADYIPETECPISPLDWVASNVVKENTSPTFKLKQSENCGALEFVRASGRVGKLLQREGLPHMLREQNCGRSFALPKLSPTRNASKKRSDWLSKDVSNASRKGNLKRAATLCGDTLSEHQWKRNLLSLNRSSERKLKQTSLTQMQAMRQERHNKQNDEEGEEEADISTFCEEAGNNVRWGTRSSNVRDQQQLKCQRTNTVDIFQNTDESNDESNAEDDAVADETHLGSRHASATEVFPFQSEHGSDDDETPSVLVLTEPAATIIELDDSNDEEGDVDKQQESVPQRRTKPNVKMEAFTQLEKPGNVRCHEQEKQQQQQQQGRQYQDKQKPNQHQQLMQKQKLLPLSNTVKLLHDEWTQEPDESDILTNCNPTDQKPKTLDKRISLKNLYNIDCQQCQSYIDFMGTGMEMDEIEDLLRRCSRHKPPNSDFQETPTNFWDPLMPTFSQNDPRNRTLLEDPVRQRKRADI